MAAAPCPEDAVLSDGFTMLHLPRRKRARTIGGMGMWTFSRCLELWRARGDFPGYEALSAAAEASEVSGEIDLQAPSLFSPDNMEEAIWDELHCRTTPAQTTRLIFEGLARDLAAALRKFREPFNRVILGGGPSVNLYLRKLIQSRLEWPLAAGEQEATVAGNLLVQHEVLP
jgi:sugar (pentulose or hexulose) kinase